MSASAGAAASSSKSEEASGANGNGSGGVADGEEKKEDRTFECNICLDTARDAVVSMCGHLFW